MMHILHNWNPWGKTHATDFSHCLVQYRNCKSCNLIQVRVIESARNIKAEDANELPLDSKPDYSKFFGLPYEVPKPPQPQVRRDA